MSDDFSSKPYYQKLIRSLKAIFPSLKPSESKGKPREELEALWKVGKEIEIVRQQVPHGQRKTLDRRLIEDSPLSRTDLFDLIRFYGIFPEGINQAEYLNKLTWTHVRESLILNDPKIFQFYLKLAAREGLSTRYLHLAIRHDLYHKEKTAGGKHPSGLLKINRAAIYVYQAQLLDIRDGDTVELMADQGFYSRHQLTGRLRGVDCSEMKGPQAQAAQEAKAYLKEVLGKLDFFMIKTYKTDSFGRYVIDLFYHPLWKDAGKIFNEGFFLNQQLLDLGMARLAPF